MTDPYMIQDASGLDSIGYNPRLMGQHFKIDQIKNKAIILYLQGMGEFHMIDSAVYPFTGIFDGNISMVDSLAGSAEDEEHVGLFSYVDGGTIRNLSRWNPQVRHEGSQCTGYLAGSMKSGKIKNCVFYGGDGTHHLVGCPVFDGPTKTFP